jgi:hypothetical protein
MNLPTVTSVTRTYDSPVATITLDETARHRRRMRMVSDRMENGATVAFLLDLPQRGCCAMVTAWCWTMAASSRSARNPKA